MDNEFLCNFKKCRKALSNQAWVTSCSHIFCNDDGIREFKKAFVCPACDTTLPGQYDIIKVDLNPSEQYKSMVLAGQRPEIIFEVCSRAIAFWTYQVHQEIMFQEYIATKSKERSTQLEKYYENILQKTKNELERMKQQQEANKKEVEAFKRKNAELSEKLKERVRQHQKLQTVYEALRRKFISPSYFERQEHQKEILDKPQEPFMTSAASEIICQQNSKKPHKSKRVSHATTGDDFILRPVHTPTNDTSIDPGVLNFSSQGLFPNEYDNRNVPPRKHFT